MDETTKRPDTDEPVEGATLPETRGLIDGSLNDANIASNSNVLGALLGSRLEPSPDNNANTRSNGER